MYHSSNSSTKDYLKAMIKLAKTYKEVRTLAVKNGAKKEHVEKIDNMFKKGLEKVKQNESYFLNKDKLKKKELLNESVLRGIIVEGIRWIIRAIGAGVILFLIISNLTPLVASSKILFLIFKISIGAVTSIIKLSNTILLIVGIVKVLDRKNVSELDDKKKESVFKEAIKKEIELAKSILKMITDKNKREEVKEKINEIKMKLVELNT